MDTEDPGRLVGDHGGIAVHASERLILCGVQSCITTTDSRIPPFCPPSHLFAPSPLSNYLQLQPDGDIALCLTQQDLIHPRPAPLRNLQQLLREVAHKEPRNRLLRTVHQNPEPTVRDREAVLRGRFAPFSSRMQQDGGVEVRQRPGGRLYGQGDGWPAAVVHVPAAAYVEV